MMKAILPILLIFMLFPLPAKGSEWLGSYVGSEIPGYEILGSHIVKSYYLGGPTEDLDFGSMLHELRDDCKKKNGKALVNVKYIVSLGDVSFRNKSGGGITKVSPGVYGTVLADCVTRVKKK